MRRSQNFAAFSEYVYELYNYQYKYLQNNPFCLLRMNNQSHYIKNTQGETFMEEKMCFGSVLGQMAIP